MQEMTACVESASSDSARLLCKTNTAKAALAKTLGKDVSEVDPTVVNRYTNDAGVQQIREQMRACVEGATNATAKLECRAPASNRRAASLSMKGALAQVLGKDESDVTGTDVYMFQERAAVDDLMQTMEACMDGTAADCTTDACTNKRNTCRTEEAKKSLAALKGKASATNVTDTELNLNINRCGKGSVRRKMRFCMDGITDPDGNDDKRAACRNTEAKKALASSLGKKEDDITATEFEGILRDAAKEDVLKEMNACVESATGATAKAQCKAVTAKATLVKSLGKKTTEVSTTEVNEFVKDAAKDEVAKTMNACKDASTGTATCKSTAVKNTLALSLGKEAAAVTSTDVNMFVADAAKSEVRDTMKACMEAASDDNERGDCKGTTAKAALAKSLGKDTTEIDSTQLTRFVNDAAKVQVKDTMKACKQAGASDCRTKSKAALATSLGKSSAANVTETELVRFVESGAKAQVKDTMQACMDNALSAANRTRCKLETAKAALVESLGVGAADVSPTKLEEFVADAASEQVVNAYVGFDFVDEWCR